MNKHNQIYRLSPKTVITLFLFTLVRISQENLHIFYFAFLNIMRWQTAPHSNQLRHLSLRRRDQRKAMIYSIQIFPLLFGAPPKRTAPSDCQISTHGLHWILTSKYGSMTMKNHASSFISTCLLTLLSCMTQYHWVSCEPISGAIPSCTWMEGSTQIGTWRISHRSKNGYL